MNIAFDATALLGPMSKNRGIGNYALSQFKNILEMDKENNYFFINFFEPFTFENKISDTSRLKEFYFYMGKDNFLLNTADYKKMLEAIIRKFVQENHIDVFYITSPFDSSIIPYEKEWFADARVVATVYDIIPYVFKKHYLGDKVTYQWYMQIIEQIRKFDEIMVISDSVRDDLVNYLNFDPQKITTIYGAADSNIYKEIRIEETEKKELCENFGIVDKFIMCTGGDDERKNIEGLIEAYAKISKELIEQYQLVIVCKLSANAVEKYNQIICKCGVENRVILTNFVSMDTLVKLYNLATAMAFPSKYEGFGLPVVEAWMCGTPVLTSNNSSLGEIAKDAAVLVDPNSIKSIREGLEQLLQRTDLADLLKQGKKKLEIYNWENVAAATIRGLTHLEPVCLKNVSKKSIKERIAYFTPLPPIQSGISDYSVDILNELSNYYDIDVFIDNGYSADCKLADNITVFKHTKFKDSSQYKKIVYQVGNSLYHQYMYNYIHKYKGIVVLHDYNMHGVFYAISMSKNADINLYRKMLSHDFEKEELSRYINNLECGVMPPDIYNCQVNGYITDFAQKIIVHSNEAYRKLLEKNISRCVNVIPSYTKIEPLVNKKEAKMKMEFQENEFVLSSIGHVHETKRALPILHAFKRLADQYSNVKLVFVGKVAEELKDTLFGEIRELQLNDKVKVTGFVELDELLRYIDLSDICLNLRYPYNGETSGSLMRMLGKGKCVVLNNIGSFGEVPDGCCVKIPSVEELTESEEEHYIYQEMSYLIENQEEVKKIETNARNYAITNLELSIIGLQYKNFIDKEERYRLSEKELNRIKECEITEKFYTIEETHSLAATLAYINSYSD